MDRVELTGALATGINVAYNKKIIRLLVPHIVPAVGLIRLQELILAHSIPVQEICGNHVFFLVNRPEVAYC